MNNLWNWKKTLRIQSPSLMNNVTGANQLPSLKPSKTVSQVVNQDITNPNSHEESTVAKPNHDEQLNKDIAEPNSHEERDINSKSTGAKQKSRKKVTKVLGKEGKQDVKSVQQKKTTARKPVAKGRNKVVMADSVENSITCDQREKMSAEQPHTNRKSEEEERDHSEVAGSNLSHQVSPLTRKL